MSDFADILDNCRDVIQGITPATEADRPWRLYTGVIDTAPKVSARERGFALEVGPKVGVVDAGPLSLEIYLSKEVSVAVAYPLGKDLLATTKQVHRDLDRLVYELLAPSGYGNAGYTGLELGKRVPTGIVEFEVDEDFTFLIVRIPFDVTYRQTFN